MHSCSYSHTLIPAPVCSRSHCLSGKASIFTLKTSSDLMKELEFLKTAEY